MPFLFIVLDQKWTTKNELNTPQWGDCEAAGMNRRLHESYKSMSYLETEQQNTTRDFTVLKFLQVMVWQSNSHPQKTPLQKKPITIKELTEMSTFHKKKDL